MILQEIFDLVSNMSKKEKSFFVRYTKMYSNNSHKRNYILLYDKIYQQTQEGKLDERKLLECVGKKIDLKNFNNYKKYLHQQLLQSLVIYHKNTTPPMAINNAIQTIHILYNKGLILIGRRLLKKTKAKIKKLEDFGNLIYILNLESILTSSKNNSYSLLKTERDLAIKQYDQINNLYLFNELCFDLNIKESFFSRNDPRFEELYNNPLLEEKDVLLSNKAKVYCYMTKSLLLFMACDFENSRLFQYKILNIIEKTSIAQSTQINVYQNIMYQSLFLGDFKTYHYFEEKMQQNLFRSNSTFETFFYQRTLLFYYRMAKKRKEGMALLEIISPNYLSTNPRPLNLLESLLITEIIPFLCTIKEYATALIWINFWYSLPASGTLIRFKLIIKALEIIIHLELKNLLLVPHLLNSFKRELKKQISIGDFERLLLDFFHKSCNDPNHSNNYQELIKTTVLQLEKLEPKIENPFWIHFFDFRTFFNSKIEL